MSDKREFGGLLVDEILLGAKEWTAIIVAILGAFGLFIANLVQAIKARADAQKTRAEAQEIRIRQQAVLDQFSNNGGATMKDATDRIEIQITETTGHLEAQLKTIRSELGFQRREILRLAEVDDQDRELANEMHKDIKKSLGEIKQDLKAHIDDTPNVVSKVQKEVLEILEKEEPECN